MKSTITTVVVRFCIPNYKQSKTKICDLGWGIDRQPFTKNGIWTVQEHRKMIATVRHEYDIHKISPIESYILLSALQQEKGSE